MVVGALFEGFTEIWSHPPRVVVTAIAGLRGLQGTSDAARWLAGRPRTPPVRPSSLWPSTGSSSVSNACRRCSATLSQRRTTKRKTVLDRPISRSSRHWGSWTLQGSDCHKNLTGAPILHVGTMSAAQFTPRHRSAGCKPPGAAGDGVSLVRAPRRQHDHRSIRRGGEGSTHTRPSTGRAQESASSSNGLHKGHTP